MSEQFVYVLFHNDQMLLAYGEKQFATKAEIELRFRQACKKFNITEEAFNKAMSEENIKVEKKKLVNAE